MPFDDGGAVARNTPSRSLNARGLPAKGGGKWLLRRDNYPLEGEVGAKRRVGVTEAQIFPWQCLYFLPEPQGQGALR